MTNTITRTLLVNGARSMLLHVYLESDGVTGELKNYVLVDPTVYDGVFTDKIIRPDMKLTVTQIWHSLGWFDALLSFDDLVPAPSWVCTRDSCNHIDFRHFGGIAQRYVDPDTAKATDRTGKILLSTNGFAPAGSMGTLIIEIRKSVQ